MTHLLNEAKRKFFTDFVEDNSSDQGRLFRATRTLLGKNDSTLSFPDYDDKSLLVNDIARKTENDAIRNRIPDFDKRRISQQKPNKQTSHE